MLTVYVSAGGRQTFRKKALRDVKNTLQAAKNDVGKPVGKVNIGNTVAASCNPAAKDHCASATPKEALKEAMKVKCDSVDKLSWDYCSCEEQYDGKPVGNLDAIFNNPTVTSMSLFLFPFC